MTGDADFLAIGICAAVISLTLWVTFAASRRSRSATGFFAAGRSITQVPGPVPTSGVVMKIRIA